MMFLIAFAAGGCSLFKERPIHTCPPFPIGGEKVAEELENIPFHGYEDFWSWMDKLGKLKDQLDVAR